MKWLINFLVNLFKTSVKDIKETKEMANFEKAHNIVMNIEGGYSNDPLDAGKETYKGISRRFHFHWEGWKIIDEYREEATFPQNLYSNSKLNDLVPKFYKTVFWDKFSGDKISSQIIANRLFNIGVNQDVRRAVRYLQIGLNILNRNEKETYYSDLVEDGLIGRNTLNALSIYLNKDKPLYLLIALKLFQGMHSIEYTRKNSGQEKFIRGWLQRAFSDDE